MEIDTRIGKAQSLECQAAFRPNRSKDLSYDGSVTWTECPRKNSPDVSCWLHAQTAAQKSAKGQVAWLYHRSFLVLSWC